MEIKQGNSGSLIISEEVVAKIASVAALDVNGVADVVEKYQDIKKVFKNRSKSKSVVVLIKDNQLMIDIFVRLKEGAKVAETSLKIQQEIKESVQNMTNTVVTKVNVHVCEIELNKNK